MNFCSITKEKYLQYFNSDKEHSLSDTEMKEFLNDMIVLCEVDPPAQSPTEILLNIKNKLGYTDSLIRYIPQIVESDLIEYLTEVELFSILWYISCKNSFLYEDLIYLRFTSEGVIGKLIERLSDLSKSN